MLLARFQEIKFRDHLLLQYLARKSHFLCFTDLHLLLLGTLEEPFESFLTLPGFRDLLPQIGDELGILGKLPLSDESGDSFEDLPNISECFYLFEEILDFL